jgi:hypothetical protein
LVLEGARAPFRQDKSFISGLHMSSCMVDWPPLSRSTTSHPFHFSHRLRGVSVKCTSCKQVSSLYIYLWRWGLCINGPLGSVCMQGLSRLPRSGHRYNVCILDSGKAPIPLGNVWRRRNLCLLLRRCLSALWPR